MQASDYLTILNILVAFLGVLFVVFTLFEWSSLRSLKKELQNLEFRIRTENYEAMKAAHRVIASYSVTDIDARIALLQSAANDCPEAFNVYNALGYAYAEKGDYARAIDAFQKAIQTHPKDKAGYCDLGFAYFQSGQKDLAVRYFRQAIFIDPSARQDILNDVRLKDILPYILK